ncbi:hypothetical protein FOZ63_017661, partial [Perkinsus olseni]
IGSLSFGLDIYSFRAPGILQRIAICYAAGVLLRKLVLDVGDNATLLGAIKNHSRVLAVGLGCLGTFIPVNKALWTPSYCILTGGICVSALGSVYWADPITGNVLYVVSRGYTLPSVMLTYTLLQLS